MYKIEAVIRPERLSCVTEQLAQLGFAEFVVREVHGHDSHAAAIGCYRGVRYAVPYAEYLCLELAVPDTALDAALDRIVQGAFTGQAGDGKIFVSEFSDVIDIAPLTTAAARPAQAAPQRWADAYHGPAR
jgi:nitrogen regulatory protein P-II 1